MLNARLLSKRMRDLQAAGRHRPLAWQKLVLAGRVAQHAQQAPMALPAACPCRYKEWSEAIAKSPTSVAVGSPGKVHAQPCMIEDPKHAAQLRRPTAATCIMAHA